MKYIKSLIVVTMAMACTTAVAATASATTVTSSGGATPTIEASAGEITFHGVVTVTCQKSTFKGAIESHGSGVTATGSLSSLTFSECNQHVTIISVGRMVVHPTAPNPNGLVTWEGRQIVFHLTSLGLTCEYTTHEGGSTLTGGSPAKIEIDSEKIARTGGSIFCGSSAEWTGSYTITSPGTLNIDS